MKRKFFLLALVLLPISISSVYAECSEQDRDACIDSDGKFDYDAFEDSFWEPVDLEYHFENNSTITFTHKKDGLGLKAITDASVEDELTVVVPRTISDAYHRLCETDPLMVNVYYDVQYPNTTPFKGKYQDTILANEIINQTHRTLTIPVLPTMSFELLGTIPLGNPNLFSICGASNGYLSYYAPPNTQIKNGVALNDIHCNGDLDLILRPNQNGAACVTETSFEKLLGANWIVPTSKEV